MQNSVVQCREMLPFIRDEKHKKGRSGCVQILDTKTCQAQKGRKHRFPHELCGKICYCSWPRNKPRHASIFGTHSNTRAVPAFHCRNECLKAFFRHASVFKTHRHAVFQCLKKPPTSFRHTSVFKTCVSTRECPFLKRAFSPI